MDEKMPAAAATAEREEQRIVLPGQDPEGGPILGVLVKRTYDVVSGGACVRAEKDVKLLPGDVHYDDPMNSSVRFETDFLPYKIATDVVFNGSAHTPKGEPVSELTASIFVGTHRKDLRVTGDRTARWNKGGKPSFTDPEPFRSMEIRYERAYGGVDIASDPEMPCVYIRNYVGLGFVIANEKHAVDGLSLPNIENPGDLLTPDRLCVGHFKDWERQPMPDGLGWVAKHWHHRGSLAGVMPGDRKTEKELREMYSRMVPEDQKKQWEDTKLPDMDFRFFNGASPGLALPFLNGDEEIRLVHLHPDGEATVRLPGERPRLGLDIGEGIQEPVTVLQTVQIRMDEGQIDLVWRAAVPYPGLDWLPEMKKMEVHVR